MSVLADRASGAGVLDRLQVLRSAPTPLRGAPAATWPPSPRTGVRQLRVAGPGLQPWLQDTTTTRTDPAGSTLATPVLGPRNGVHLPRPCRCRPQRRARSVVRSADSPTWGCAASCRRWHRPVRWTVLGGRCGGAWVKTASGTCGCAEPDGTPGSSTVSARSLSESPGPGA